MNSMKLARELLSGDHRVRCKYWGTCDADHCVHHSPHYPANRSCVFNSPVKYCGHMHGFVHDVPYIGGAYANDECDPNLAFKAKRDAERRRHA